MKSVATETALTESQRVGRNKKGAGDRTDFYLGVDGGGTNCRAVIVGADEVLQGEGQSDAANFLRTGLEIAINNIISAVDEACHQAEVGVSQIKSACIGLAGVSHPEHHSRMLKALESILPLEKITLETDARVALAGATGNQPGVVIIAGTGSIACGINSRARFARAGGWGPAMGDEGSGSYIGRRALEAVVMAYDYRGEPTIMMEPVLKHFGVLSAPELPPVIYDSPSEVPGKISQLSRIVVDAAAKGDKVAREILRDAAKELARAVIAVIEQLRMEGDTFRIAYVGGVFEAGELILGPLRREILKYAPGAVLEAPIDPPVIGAAKMALALVRNK